MDTDEKYFCFEQELTKKDAELGENRKEMLKHGIELTLKDIVDKMESHQNELSKMMMMKASQKQLQSRVSDIIVEATDGRMRVPHYSPSDIKMSVTWIYVGTHWEEIPEIQILIDFIRKACKKMELWEDFIDVNPFSCKLRKQVELKLSRYTPQPDREDSVLVNFINGTLEIRRDGEPCMREHRREDYLTYVLPYPYDENARCPRFLQYLDEVLPDRSTHTTILEYTASRFVPWLHIEKVLGFVGGGSNGKSVLLNVLRQLFGKPNVAYESLSDLTTNESHRANIEGKLANICTENAGRIDESIFKILASHEPVSCRKYYSQPYTMTNYAGLFFSFNDMPRIKSGYAIMRRWLLVKFNVCISEERADSELGDKLAQELPGIMNLVIGKLLELLKRKKFSESAAVKDALKELEYQNNPVLQFLTDRCEPSTVPTKGSDLYKSYCEYCEQTNHWKMTNQEFYRRVEEKYKPVESHHQKAFLLRVARYED